MTTVLATIGLVSGACCLGCLAELWKSYETERRVTEYMSRRGWVRAWDLCDDLGLELTEATFWLDRLQQRRQVVQSKRGTYWRWKTICESM